MPQNLIEIKSAWESHAVALAEWTRKHLVVRDDTFGTYYYNHITRELKQTRVNQPLTQDRLISHYRGIGNPIGLYAQDPEGNARWCGIDIDAHKEKREVNRHFAIHIGLTCLELGIRPIVGHSNGNEGYHVVVPFDWTSQAKMRQFGLWLCRKWQDFGLDHCPEVFPKQFDQKPFGNWLRLPGHHHKRSWWTEFYDVAEQRWYRGAEAPAYLLAQKPNSTDLIPKEVDAFVPVPAVKKTFDIPLDFEFKDLEPGDDWFKAYRGDLRTLRVMDLAEKYDLLTGHSNGQWHEIICPWYGEHTSGGNTAFLIDNGDDRFPGFFCHHQHCQGRTLKDFLALVPAKEIVDSFCDKNFGGQSDEKKFVVPDISLTDLPKANQQVVAAEQPKRRAFTPAQYLAIPKARFLIRKHIVERSLCLIYGQSGAGKSFFGLDVSFCIATGKSLFGQWQAQKGGVVYLVSEGDGSFGVRLEAYCKHHGLSVAAINNMALIPEAFNFQETGKVVTSLAQILQDDCPQLKVKTVVVDTLNKNIMGDENSPKDMQKFIATCEAIKKRWGCTVIVIHHAGKDDSRGARGHSSLFAACDTVLRVAGDAESETATIVCEKQKSAKPFSKYNVFKTVVEVDPLDLDNPDSVVLTYMGEDMSMAEKMQALAAMFPTGEENAITVKNVWDRNEPHFQQMNWTTLKNVKKRVVDAVAKGLLAEGEWVETNHAGTKTYYRL